MKMNEYIQKIKERFMEEYGEAECSLDYENPLELLIATQLATQCTDARVNIVSKELFKVFPTALDMAEGDICEIERIVKPCGLFRMKPVCFLSSLRA